MQLESQIIVRCKEGDREAFRWLVQHYQRLVFSLALKMMVDEEEAKDVVQETFLRVWQSVGSYDVRRPFVTWLYTIASNLCLDRLRRTRVVCPLPQDEDMLHRFASSDDGQQVLECREWVAIVRVLAARLGTKQRLVFTLCQLEGLTFAEAEQVTGMTARQLKDNLHAARQIIRKRLKELGYE